jgi:protein TonB
MTASRPQLNRDLIVSGAVAAGLHVAVIWAASEAASKASAADAGSPEPRSVILTITTAAPPQPEARPAPEPAEPPPSEPSAASEPSRPPPAERAALFVAAPAPEPILETVTPRVSDRVPGTPLWEAIAAVPAAVPTQEIPAVIEPAPELPAPAPPITVPPVAETTESTGSPAPAPPAVSPPVPAPAPSPATAPRAIDNPAPKYPRVARQRGYEGTVELLVHVLASGRVDDVKLERSSGSSSLDRAAIRGVKRWRFTPAKRDGRAIDIWIEVPIEFNLVDR